ncbi:C-myc promoter-binding protein-like [Patiria miniata]|uniref:DENN domain-containing protein 4C n=1 Tax=Patiria miniata TaxID=46514 RepID=A0A914BIX5_PATMI|nr:C-myc promoter-binding protein-like [Patiria miniata]
MEDHGGPRVANYFVVAGMTKDSRPLEEEIQSEGQRKPPRSLAPITDVAIIIRGQGEKPPPGFTVIENTPSGFVADLNHGSIGSSSIFLCYKRGFDKLPLTDIGILHEGKERVMPGCEIVSTTPNGNPANVNTRIGVGSQRAYLTYRRASETSPHNSLAVIDICVILTNKGETPPHAFCLINKNLNKGSMVGSDVYLCYKKSAVRGNSLAYQSGILNRYPLVDDEEFPLPESIARFCMPLGATIECWSTARHHPLPVFSTFVLTDSTGGKFYGAAVAFYEGYPEEKLTPQQQKDLGLKPFKKNNTKLTYSVHTNKCVCLLSRWPFFDAFKKFLTFIYRLSLSGPHTIPIERHIAHFMSEVPFPTVQRPRILMELGHDSLILAQPQTSPMPLSGASFCAMLRNLAPENSMNMLAFVLLEHKLLLHSLRPALLTGVAEAVAAMIFPFMWQCPYIPLCPLSLSAVISAPLPVIIGVDSRYFDMYEPPTDATCLDIDTNSILQSEERKPVTWKILPKKPAKRLHSMLNKLYYELCESGIGDGVSDEQAVEVAPLEADFNRKKKQLQMEHRIQEAFLTFMSSMLKGYSHNLLPITQQPNHRVTDASARFDHPGFMKTREKTSHPFFKQFLKTQMFYKFIEERSFISGNDERFAFFDECIDKLDNNDGREEVQMIDAEDQQGSEHTVFVTPPDANGFGNEEYLYDKFPLLRPELFDPTTAGRVKQPIKTPLSARGLRGSGQQSSPFPRRTKHEIRNSQRMAKQQAASPEQWASFLLGQCYALWFLHLPSYVKATRSKTRALRTAFEVLKRMQAQELQLADEVCYRVLMQLCGQYSQPVLAVQVYMEMKRRGIEPNAITYGFYNMAVLESTWPASGFSGYQQWVKLRNALRAVTLFRRGLNHRRSIYSDTSSEVDVGSGTSGDSGSSDPLPDSKEDLIQLMSSQAANLTREEKSSTGNSDMGYSSMILDESAPNEVLASPELSPIRFGAEKSATSSSCDSDAKDATDGEEKDDVEDGEHSQDTLKRKDRSEAVDLIKQDVAEVVGPSSANSTPVNHSLDSPIDGGGSSSKSNSNKPADQPDAKGTKESGTSIVRHSRSSVGSTGSMGTLRDSTGSSAGVVLSGLISLENSVDESVFEGVDTKEPAADSSEKRRHRSADHSVTIPMHGSLHKRNKSGDTNSPFGLSLSSQGSSIDRESSVSMELFGSDAKILAGIADEESSIATSPLGGRTNSIHCRPSPTLVEVTHATRSYSVGSRPNFTFRTPNGSISNKELSDQTKTVHSERTSFPAPAKDCKKDLLISFEEENSEEAESKTGALTNHDRSGSDDQGSADLLDLGLDTVRDPSGSAQEKDLVDLRTDWNDTIEEENSEEVAAEDALSPRTTEHEVEEGPLEENPSSPIFQGDNLDSNSSKSGSRDSLDSNKDKTTPRKGSLFSGILNTGLTPRLNRQSLTKTLSNASSQMETFGTAFKARTMGFATKIGEYTRSFSSPAAPKTIPSRNSAMGSLNSLEGMTLVDETTEMAGSWNDSAMDNISLGNMGIHLQGTSLEGSCQSLNQPGQDSEDAGIRRHAIEVHITSCHQCFSCQALLYDEAVMAGWSADESNLKTRCCFCSAQLVPFLNIAMRDFRNEAAMPVCTITPSPSSESVQSIHSAPLIKRKDSAQTGEESEEVKKGAESNPSVDNLSLEEEDEEEEEEEESGEAEQDEKDGNLPSRIKSDKQESITKLPVTPSLSAGEVTLRGELRSARLSPTSTRRRSSSECMTVTDLAAKGHANGGRAMTLPRCKPIEEFKDLQQGLLPGASAGSLSSSVRNSLEFMPPPSKECKVGPISVPYLSPLVLRKEVENVIENEGEACLRAPSFVVQHPIIFWNLVWYFQRLNFPNYLQGVLLAAYSESRDNSDYVQWLSSDSRYVKISVLWDNVKLYDDSMLPMYLLWGAQGTPSLDPLIKDQQIHVFSKPFMVQLVKYIRYNNVYQPIVLLLEELKKLGDNTAGRRSIYRELLFLSFVAMGRENIDQDAFDQQYRQAFYKLEKENGPFGKLLINDDKPPPLAVQMCRKAFGDLML